MRYSGRGMAANLPRGMEAMSWKPFRGRWPLVLVLFLTVPSGSLRAEETVVGMSAAFSGPSKGLGIELYRGSKAYLDHVNAQGGVHGRKIVIKAYDDGYNP